MRPIRLLALPLLLTLGSACPSWGEPRFPDLQPSAAPPAALVSGPDAAPLPAPPASGARPLDDNASTPPATLSLGWATLRLLGALVAVGLLLVLGLRGYRRLFQRGGRPRGDSPSGGALGLAPRWFSRWVPASVSDEDRLEVVGRSYLGPKESVCVVQVGRERFLVGITAARISLLGRLETAQESAGELEDPEATDFARELTGAGDRRDSPTEGAIRVLVARSRDRLARLGRARVVAGGRRG